ncbi:MAG TPA: NAD(+) diphosphatase [Solirubrobacteraceae bacterium]|nr:NAD(+) diphosphatase [Solirubrobacteraceae bacterium]
MPDPITFTGELLDRAAEHRTDEDWLAAQRGDPRARAVVAGDAGIRVTDGRLALVPLAELDAPGEPLLLGLDGDGPVFAVGADGPRAEAVGLREAAAFLPEGDAGLAAHAAALVNWHRRHPHCSVCGARTAVVAGGIMRRCERCGSEHHPRTDPVVIMLVTDGDRVLLGRQPSWPPGRYSALAGFVEPGESLEEAVAREIKEEAGVEVGPPAYIASQPWPFPTSLMIGFIAPWRAGEPRRIDRELEDLRWFTADEIVAAGREDGPYGLPPRFAIARRLLEHWLET